MTGLTWPEELRVWCSLHDGIWSVRNESAILPPLYNPLSWSALVESYQSQCALASQDPLDPELLGEREAKPAGELVADWLATFLPFGESALGNTLFLDLRSGPQHGCVREFHDEGASCPVWAQCQ